MLQTLIFLTVLLPAAAAVLMPFIRNAAARRVLVPAFAAAMIGNAVLLAVRVLRDGPAVITAEGLSWVPTAVTAVDCVTLLVILYYGFRLREWKIVVPSFLQAAGLIYIELFRRPAEAQILCNVDNLGLVLVLITSILGPLIAVFALGYMDRHEKHRKVEKSRQHVFFSILFLFLFAMNALCIADNLLHIYAFWEITTLCSFLLIGFDGTRSAIVSARRALWLNSVCGLFFILGVDIIGSVTDNVSITYLVSQRNGAAVVAGLMFLCCAGFVKSAQFPFQPWLLGAMVAPTPVSALLHSSTMVKAGVYLIVRLSPMFGGTAPGYLVSLVGGFTFMAASAIAISQSNGKRVLAYSTIANLGLIISCAGLGGQAALSAAILLILYHALSKALLFLCMGTVELQIGSRNIEDMFGIFTKMPYTTSIMALGMLSMMLPPFGVLITKWLALEAAVRFPLVLLLIVLGSAFTIVFWVKWIGAALTVYKTGARMESLPFSIKFTLGAIGAGIPVLTALLPFVNNGIVSPAVAQLLNAASTVKGEGGGIAVYSNGAMTGAFGSVLVLLIVLCAVFALLFAVSRLHPVKLVAPYSGGENTGSSLKGRDFTGPRDRVEHIKIHNYYFSDLFSENKLGPVCSVLSFVLILVMFGVSA